MSECVKIRRRNDSIRDGCFRTHIRQANTQRLESRSHLLYPIGFLCPAPDSHLISVSVILVDFSELL